MSPAANPCGSCPYRRDVPSGVWEAEEYAKLPAYDRDTGEQPHGVFLCHRQDGRICAGWAGCHDMGRALAVRLGSATGRLSDDVIADLLDFETSTPLFHSGTEAADHGLRDVEDPDADARRVIDKLQRGGVHAA